MNNNIKFKINIFEILSSLLALFLILNSQSIWQRTIDINYHIYEICFVLILIFSIYTINKYGIIKKHKSKAILISIAYYILLVFIVIFSVSKENLIRFLSRYAVFPFFLFYFLSAIPLKKKYKLLDSYINWASLIAFITTLMWLLSTFRIIHPTRIINVDWFGEYESYYNIYFSSDLQYIDWLNIGVKRNIGIFTEGPMYVLVLIFSLSFMFLIRKYYPVKKWKLYSLIAAIITTASATGYILALLIGCIWLTTNNKKKSNKIIAGTILAIIAILGASIMMVYKSGTASYIARMDDYLAGIKCWLSSPIIGNGYENQEIIKEFMSSSRSWNTGFSNAIFSVLAYGGILFTIPYICPLIYGYKAYRKYKKIELLTLIVIYIMFYFTMLFYSQYINFMVWGFLIANYICLSKEEILN